MDKNNLKETSRIIDQNWSEMNITYEKFAKTFNLSHTSMTILDTIQNKQPLTQKDICSTLFLPKQTVNVIINDFLKKGYLTLKECKKDKRNKEILFTKEGQIFASKVLNSLNEVESKTLKCIPEGHLDICLETIIKYRENLEKFINDNDEKELK